MSGASSMRLATKFTYDEDTDAGVKYDGPDAGMLACFPTSMPMPPTAAAVALPPVSSFPIVDDFSSIVQTFDRCDVPR